MAANGYEVAKVNLLLSIATEDDELLCEKYKATAIIEYLRNTEKLTEAGVSKSKQPGSHLPPKDLLATENSQAQAVDEEPTPRTHEKESGPAFNNVRLNQEEENTLYMDLAEFLLEKSLSNLSLKCLDYVTEKDSVKVLFCMTKAKMLKLKYQEAAEDLYNLFTNVDQTLTDAYIMFGHCKFILAEYDDALNAYYKAIRVSNL